MINEKKLVGTVISDKMQKTRIMKTYRKFRVEKYEKTVSRSKNYMFHDEKNESKLGDKVEIVFSRPLSSQKKWKLNRIIEISKEIL